MRVAVFCASADGVGEEYFRVARELGEVIGGRGWELVYGGSNVGLMREVAEATQRGGGRVTGVIPECIARRGVAAEGLDELVVTPDMKERKARIRERADAFVALPGGWGTLEEVTEVITLKQLGEHRKPIVFLNAEGFYDGLLAFVAGMRGKGFVSAAYDSLYAVAGSVEEAVAYLEGYREEDMASKY